MKALPGLTTHEAEVTIPIVDNSQDMAEIEAAITPRLLAPGAPPAYLIRGHGLYGWGSDMAEAERVIETARAVIAEVKRSSPSRGALAALLTAFPVVDR